MPSSTPHVARVRLVDGKLAAAGLFSDFEMRSDALPPPGTIVAVSGDEVRVLAAAGSALARVYGVLRHFRLDPMPQPHVLDEVAAIDREAASDPQLVDRTDLPFVTIDNEDSRDLDQALFVEADDGGLVVWYAIADPAYFVSPGTALFEAALEAGTSFYLPGLSVPMLPPTLSEGLVSLNPGVDRRSLLFRIALDDAGHVVSTRIERARIRSRAKLSYNGVQAFFDDPDGNPLAEQSYTESLLRLRDVGERRIALSPTDEEQFCVVSRRRNDVERWNEQLSLLCNIEGARLLRRHGRDCSDLHPVFRVHLPPLRPRLDGLRDTIAGIVDAQGLSDVWRWAGPDSGVDLADYLAALPLDASRRRVRRALERQVRYANRASEFSAEVGPHHALGVDAYARFSAPMREIVGVFTHKELLEAMGLQPPCGAEADVALRSQVIEAANAAKRRQKRIDKEIALLAIDQLLGHDVASPEHVRPRRAATVVGLRPSRVYLALDDVGIDLKIYVEDLAARHGCGFDLDGAVLRPVGGEGPRFRIGDGVSVTTLGYDASGRRYVLDATPLGSA